MKRAQVTMEFVTIAGFMFLIFASMFVALQSTLTSMKQAQTLEIMSQLSDSVSSEVRMAISVGDGYSRNFEIPFTIKGDFYNIGIEDGLDLVIEYDGLEHVVFLDRKVAGSVQKGTNLIRNQNGIIVLNS